MLDSILKSLSEFSYDQSATEIGAALLVTRCLDETLDVVQLKQRIDALAARQSDSSAPWETLTEEGFRGDPEFNALRGSSMDQLIEDKRGLPISLGVLLIHTSRQAGFDASGINFPGHFLVKVGDTLVDPFFLKVTNEAEWLATLSAEAIASDPFAHATPQAILMRMLNNLKIHFAQRLEFHRALDMTDCQLQVFPKNAGLLLDRGEFWIRLGSVAGAREAFTAAEQAAGTGEHELAELARLQLQGLMERSDTFH
jgi:regulator of sirC expression with transglutaminase-like and TPR domain